MFLNCSTWFERHTAHHQQLKNCNCSLWFYIRLWLSAAAGNHKRIITNNKQIINSTTRSHLVGNFYKIYNMMHGSMNVTFMMKKVCSPFSTTVCVDRKSINLLFAVILVLEIQYYITFFQKKMRLILNTELQTFVQKIVETEIEL